MLNSFITVVNRVEAVLSPPSNKDMIRSSALENASLAMEESGKNDKNDDSMRKLLSEMFDSGRIVHLFLFDSKSTTGTVLIQIKAGEEVSPFLPMSRSMGKKIELS